MPAALASVVILAFWLGAAVLTGAVVAPAAFAVLPTRALAGAVVGRTLPVLFVSGIVFGIGVAAMNARVGAGRFVTVASAVYAAASAIGLLVATRIVITRESLGVPLDSLDPSDPRRIAFGRMHGLSVVLMGLGAFAAFAAGVRLIRHLTAAGTPVRT